MLLLGFCRDHQPDRPRRSELSRCQDVHPRHRSTALPGPRCPGGHTRLCHSYEVTPRGVTSLSQFLNTLRRGHIFVSIPQHFEERLKNVIHKNGGGFSFRTLFPKESQLSNRDPILMHVKHASANAVCNTTMAPKKKNKDLWLSFIIRLDFQGKHKHLFSF
eukprot:1388112-Pleurochrysis_carterae.AAC.1